MYSLAESSKICTVNDEQEILLLLYGCVSLLAAVAGYVNAVRKRNVFGLTPHLIPLGIFVWGDAVLLGTFGVIASLVLYNLHNWWLAVTAWAVFWVVRSHGETVYWLNQQFSPLERNPPSSLPGYRFFPNDSLWFIYQLVWQCATVAAALCALYASQLWLKTL